MRPTLVSVLLLGTCAACAHVAPYERERLAHPTMRPDHGANPAEAHMNAVHEGAVGGTVGPTTGCGCN